MNCDLWCLFVRPAFWLHDKLMIIPNGLLFPMYLPTQRVNKTNWHGYRYLVNTNSANLYSTQSYLSIDWVQHQQLPVERANSGKWINTMITLFIRVLHWNWSILSSLGFDDNKTEAFWVFSSRFNSISKTLHQRRSKYIIIGSWIEGT